MMCADSALTEIPRLGRPRAVNRRRFPSRRKIAHPPGGPCHWWCKSNAGYRRGISTLELVLSLPLLLMIMALMINYGVVASWNVRCLSISRHALWSTRWPRNGISLPRPAYWPESATVAASHAGDIPVLDDPRADYPVTRGPLPAGIVVDRRLLDPARGLREGQSSIERRFPMLPRLGDYHLASDDHLLDDKWQYQRTKVPANVSRRIPAIYQLPRASSTLKDAYVRAAAAVHRLSKEGQLDPLYRDDEFIAYNARFGLGGPPDFRPRMHRFCSLNQADIDSHVQDLVDRIQGKLVRTPEGDIAYRIPGVPEVMAVAFRSLYRRVIQCMEALIEANRHRPGFSDASLRREINELESKISILDNFIADLHRNG